MSTDFYWNVRGGGHKTGEFEYEKIHIKLMSLKCDVLVILDCCRASDTDMLAQIPLGDSTHPPKKFV